MDKKDTVLTIAIDGPVGAGKSSIASQVAQRLNIPHLDTGAMYRASGYLALEAHVNIENEKEVEEFMKNCSIHVVLTPLGQQVIGNGKDVTDKIRSPEVSMAASSISKWPIVRKKMVEIQQKIAQKESIVLDGRDIGTRVLPVATAKIFLTATPQERASRRYKELKSKGIHESYEQVLKELEARDLQDSTREVDPLKAAEDAIIVDTTELNQEQVVQVILTIVEEKYGRQ